MADIYIAGIAVYVVWLCWFGLSGRWRGDDDWTVYLLAAPFWPLFVLAAPLYLFHDGGY